MRTKGKSPKFEGYQQMIGLRWRMARQAKKLKAEQVVQHLKENGYNCHKTAIYRLEKGQSEPMNFQIFIMFVCKLYQISPNDIYGAKR